jgi:hypothetical protein
MLTELVSEDIIVSVIDGSDIIVSVIDGSDIIASTGVAVAIEFAIVPSDIIASDIIASELAFALGTELVRPRLDSP